MVVQPQKTSATTISSLKFLRLCCCVLMVSLFPAFGTAAPEEPQVLGELCVLPALENAISTYREIATQGGWPTVPEGPALQEGDTDNRLLFLRKRLVASADLARSAVQGNRFDDILKEAVQRFQTRHGLTADGVVGAKTLGELNVPVDERIRQLTASLERCQPLPQALEPRHILVNIAAFTLTVFDNGKPVLSMPVIVGKTFRQTPVFNGRIASLVLNPSWEVPHSIATADLLPKIQKNPDFLAKLHLRVFRDWTANSEIEPATIDWAKLKPARFPYRLHQDPGPSNALGRVKFLFPNPYDVYLHDTPAHELFRKDARTFSSGCIRLARPLDLAVYLLQGTPLGSLAALNEAIGRDKTQNIAIPSPIAVHIVYMTAWVDNDGIVQFRPDIYHRDSVSQ